MKIIITWRCFSDNNKAYTFFRNYKELQKEQKQTKKTNKQTTKQENVVILSGLTCDIMFERGRRGRDRMIVEFTAKCAITT